ncbi:hypothetical protein [Thermococcus sp. JCM 11816]|uniref:hypothetical protein n=1 Tax=Thermococcus sp. (strain JCM 11816 / KS-1) TaxID=1295125 RepID=UPI0006D108E2
MNVRRKARTISILIFVSLFILFIHFEAAYSFGFLGLECPVFGTVIYGSFCRLFAWGGMFFFGLLFPIFFLAGRFCLSGGVLAIYFVVTFFAAWKWVSSERVLAFAGFVLSLVLSWSKVTPFALKKNLVESAVIVLLAWEYVLFVLGTLTYAVLFGYRWLCSDNFPRFSALCTLLAYFFTIIAGVSPPLIRGKSAVFRSISLSIYFLFMVFLSDGGFLYGDGSGGSYCYSRS